MTQSVKGVSLPTEQEIAIAREYGPLISKVLAKVPAMNSDTQHIDIIDEQGTAHSVRVPVSAIRLLVDVLNEIGQGHAVSIVPVHAELTTQEAADVLNVSRPFVVQLLERGEIPFHKIGTHRRVRYQDVMAFKEGIDLKRRKALDDLAEEGQRLKLGYD